MLGKTERQEEKGMTEDEMAGWHHRLNGHELKQARGDDEGQGSLACRSPWGSQRTGHNSATEKQVTNLHWVYTEYQALKKPRTTSKDVVFAVTI